MFRISLNIKLFVIKKNTFGSTFNLEDYGINLFNDGPYCGQYPGIRIETDTAGITIQGLSLVDGGYETWWYGIPAQGQYGLLIQFDISPFVPEGTVISLTAEAVTLHCEENCNGSEDPNCLTCPLTDPITLSLTVGDNFTHVPGDANFDGQVDVLDIVELVDHIINVEDYYDWNLMFIMSDLNGDYLLNIQDVIMMVGLILNND